MIMQTQNYSSLNINQYIDLNMRIQRSVILDYEKDSAYKSALEVREERKILLGLEDWHREGKVWQRIGQKEKQHYLGGEWRCIGRIIKWSTRAS
jgi:hypothetical protein